MIFYQKFGSAIIKKLVNLKISWFGSEWIKYVFYMYKKVGINRLLFEKSYKPISQLKTWLI